MKLTTLVIACCAAAGMVAVSPGTAVASGPFTDGGGNCAMDLAGSFSCSYDVTGGTGPFSTSWTVSSDAALYQISYDGSHLVAQGGCNDGAFFRLSITLTDSVGQSITEISRLYCTPRSEL